MPKQIQICLRCNKEFLAQSSNKRKYCSLECAVEANFPPKVICQYCNKEFRQRYKARTCYCSRECQKADTKKKNTRTCEQCNKEFKQCRTSSGKFCSHACYSESLKDKTPPNYDPVIITCEFCDEPFEIQECRLGKARYCSNQCYAKARQKRIPCTCLICGNSFEVWPTHHKQQFCSQKCHGIFASGKNSPFWKGGRRNYRGPNWRQQREKARKRDKYTCQHCGITERKMKQRVQVHHIRPFREFGYIAGKNENYRQANHLSNLISLCLSCHMRAEHGKVPIQPLLIHDIA